jgi:hypothetical protein
MPKYIVIFFPSTIIPQNDAALYLIYILYIYIVYKNKKGLN